MGISIDGLATGMDTTALITSMMDMERIPQNLLKTKVTQTQTFVSSLQGLNTKIADLATLAGKTAAPGSFSASTGTASSDAVTLTTSQTAANGSISFTVDSLATKHTGVSAALTAWPDVPPVLTIKAADGTVKQFTAASAKLDDVVRAVNDAGAGVTAVKVPAGKDAGGADQFRIQFTANDSGAAKTFQVFRGDAAAVAAGTAADVFSGGGAVTTSGADAKLTLWPGTDAAQAVTSATNKFTSVLPGVDVTAAKVSATAVTVSVARDDKALTDKAQALVDGLNGVFSYIKARTGNATVPGVFSADTTVREANRIIYSAGSEPINGKSPFEFGIVVTKTGTLELDKDKFSAAMAKDPAATAAALQTISARVEAASKQVSDKYDGTLTKKITGQQSMVKSFTDRIGDMDVRLAAREATLKRTFSSLEVTIKTLTTQQGWLTSQIAALPTQQEKN